ncbi:MAG TPA: hypothetical protein VNX46_17380, partial [Candidatus Acidoferrum sp.]|nr:hypothetical protein [Candidatus Acidoferrum sp.]
MKTSLCAFAFLFVGIGLVHAGVIPPVDPSGKPLRYTVEAAPAWSDLFNRTHGWFGGDGIFSIPLGGVDKNDHPDNETTLLLFSDT